MSPLDVSRAWRHWRTGSRLVDRLFPAAAMDRIEVAIAVSERRHRAEIRLAIEHSLDACAVLAQSPTARSRALQVFSDLQVWDTAENNGILVYLLLADRQVEIVADRGAREQIDQSVWDTACATMREAFAQDRFEAGVVDAVGYLGGELAKVYPVGEHNPDELPNRPTIL